MGSDKLGQDSDYNYGWYPARATGTHRGHTPVREARDMSDKELETLSKRYGAPIILKERLTEWKHCSSFSSKFGTYLKTSRANETMYDHKRTRTQFVWAKAIIVGKGETPLDSD